MKEENKNTDPIKLPDGSRKESPNDVLKEDLYTNPIKINPEVEDKFSDILSSDQYNSPIGIEGEIYDSSTLPEGYDENIKLGGDKNIPVGESQSDRSSMYLSKDKYNSLTNLNVDTQVKDINETPIELVNKNDINKSNSIIVEDRYINPVPREGIEGDSDSKLSSENYTSPINIVNKDSLDHSYILEESRYSNPIELNAEDKGEAIKSEDRYQNPIELTAEDKSPGYLLLERYMKPMEVHNLEYISSLNTVLESIVSEDSEYTENTDSLGYTIGGNHGSNERKLPPNIDSSNRRPRKDTPVGRSSKDTEDRKGLIIDDNNSESKISEFISNKDTIPIDRKIEDYRDIDESRYSGFKVELSTDSNDSEVDKGKYSDSTKIPNYSSELPEINENIVSLPVDTVPLTEDIKDKYANTAKWMGVQNDLDRGFNTVRKYEQLLGNYSQLGDWGQMVSSAVTGVLGAKNFRDNTRVPAHHIKALSDLSAVRATVQNNFVGPMGMAKQELIDELLLTTELNLRRLRKAAKEDAGRLPGDDGVISGLLNKLGGNAIKGALDTVSDTLRKITGGASKEGRNYKDPLNRPEKLKDNKVIESAASGAYVLFTNYIQSKGLNTTLSELAGSTVSNINELSSILSGENSYITTWDKINSFSKNGLDSNHVWEIIFKPYKGDLNGNYTVLPDIDLINKRNYGELNVVTNYTKWLPFTSFELQHRKLTNKSIGLFDGEFSIPYTLEFTNELRLTIADDQCKSFRWYFDTCIESTMYKTTPTATNFKVDRTSPMTAMYKNATFECTIYIMKSDFSTVKKFPLLVTLRDYSIEYVGDQDSSPSELNLHFSIVGEDSVEFVGNTSLKEAKKDLLPKSQSTGDSKHLNPPDGGSNQSSSTF